MRQVVSKRLTLSYVVEGSGRNGKERGKLVFVFRPGWIGKNQKGGRTYDHRRERAILHHLRRDDSVCEESPERRYDETCICSESSQVLT